jgi:hypothetical protein
VADTRISDFPAAAPLTGTEIVPLVQTGADVRSTLNAVGTLFGKVLGIEFIVDGGGSAITTGVKGDVEVPFACTINAATLLLDQVGSIVFDIWKTNYAGFPPTVANTITASAKPTVAAAQKSQDTTLIGWTTSINAGDTLRFNVDSVATTRRATLSLKVTRA